MDIILPVKLPWNSPQFTEEGLDNTNLAFFFREQEDAAPWMGALLQSQPWLAQPFLDEGTDSTALAFFFREQEEAPLPAVQSIPWTSRPFTDESPDSASLSYFFLEQEENPPPQVQVLPWTPRLSLDEADSTALTFFRLEDEQAAYPATQTIGWTSRVVQDEDPWSTPSTTVVDDEAGWVGAVMSVPWTSRPATDDETSAGLKFFFLEDEQPTYPAVQTITWQARPSLDEDPWTTAPTTMVEDEQPFVGLRQMVPWYSAPFTDDEIGPQLKFFALEQEEFWVAQQQTTPWTARPALDDETGEPLAFFFREQEDAWPQLVQSIPWTSRPATDDEISTRLAYFTLEQEDAWIAQRTSQPWTPRQFLDDEVFKFVSVTISIGGTVYSDEGATPLLAGVTLNCSVNGAASSGSAVSSGVNGTYTISGITAAAAAVLTIYIQDGVNVQKAVTVTRSTGANMNGVDLYQDHLNIRSDDGTPFSGTNMHTAVANAATGISAILTAVSNTATLVQAGKSLLIMPGQTYAPGGNSIIQIFGNWVNKGTFTCGTGSLNLRGTSSFTITSGGSSFFNVNSTSGTGTYTLADNLVMLGSLNLSTGTIDVSASDFSFSIAGNWSNLSSASFISRHGTVIFNGVGQTFVWTTTGVTDFWNLTKSVTVSDTFTFDYDENLVVNGLLTLQGAPGQLLLLRTIQPGMQTNLFINGTQNISYVDVQDSIAAAATAMAGPTSVDSGRNTNWTFGGGGGSPILMGGIFRSRIISGWGG